MITKKDIINAAKAVVRKSNGYRIPMLIHPRRDWLLGLLFFAVIVIGGGLVLARLYFVNQSVDALVGVEAEQIPRYREEVVNDVLAVYRERKATYDAILMNLPAVPPEAATTSEATASSTDTELLEAVDEELPVLPAE